jgi:hypothetical protein
MKRRPPNEILQKLAMAYGVAEKLSVSANALPRALDGWNQTSSNVVRVLRAHLILEYLLNSHVRAIRPSWSVRRVTGASFGNNVAFLSRIDPIVRLLAPGFTRVNLIRNRLSHDLDACVSADDKDSLLSIHFFRAWHHENCHQRDSLTDDPVIIVEQFAQFSAILLQSSSGQDAGLLTANILHGLCGNS